MTDALKSAKAILTAAGYREAGLKMVNGQFHAVWIHTVTGQRHEYSAADMMEAAKHLASYV